MIRLIITTVVMLVLAASGYGQHYPVKNYRMQDGLANSIVFRIYQDSRGFIWFCTNYGLSRFDGKTFKNYYTGSGLPENVVMSMSNNGPNSELVSTYGGGLAVLSDTGISGYPIKGGIMPGKLLYAVKHNDRVWIICTNTTTLFCVAKDTVFPIDIKTDDDIPVRFHKAIRCGNDMYLTSTNGVYKVDEHGSLHRYLPDVLTGEVKDLRQDRSGSLWVGLAGRIVHLTDGKATRLYALPTKLPVSDLVADRNGNVWAAGAEEGVFLIRNDSVQDITDKLGLSKIIVHDLFEDSEGNMWLATGGQGVYLLSSLGIMNYPIEEHKLKSYCKAITPLSDGKVAIGSMGTVSIMKQGRLSPLPLKELSPIDYIYFIHYEDERLFIGTPKGLIIKDMRPGGTDYIVKSATTIPTGVLSFKRDGDYYWLGSFNCIYRIKNDARIVDSTDKVLDVTRCNVIASGSSGQYYFGTDSGIVVYTGGNFRRERISDSRVSNVINAITSDSEGRLWFITDGGLIYKKDGEYNSLKTQDGLFYSKCIALCEDEFGTLWLGSTNGLTGIDVKTLMVRESNAGNLSNEVLSLLTNKDALFIGMVDGLSVMQLGNKPNNDPPPLYITTIKSPGQVYDMPAGISLPYNNNKLYIEFAALAFEDPEKVEYRYKISNLADSWHITQTRSVDLPALPAGDFEFVVCARRINGEWSKPVTLPIHVTAPLWQNYWLIALVIVALSWVIFFVTKRLIEGREAKKRDQLYLYNKITYLKQQALSALINPHFIFNCMNSIQHYMHNHDNYKANLYLADFAHLIRMTLEHSRSAFIDLEDEISRIKLYLSLEQLRFGEDLAYEIAVAPELGNTKIRIPNMIVQPYIENAIWHGIMPNKGIGKIFIRFERINADELSISITDNGVGINKAKVTQKATSKNPFGMKLTADRLQLLNDLLGQRYAVLTRETTDQINNVTGTCVTITLPLHPAEELLESANESPKGKRK